MKKDRDNIVRTMRDQWNDRAETNPCYYVNSVRRDWDITEYFESGARDVARLLSLSSSSMEREIRRMVLLEIGCGNGRMTRELARRFEHVYALDISERMVEQGKGLLADIKNVTFVVGNGVDLGGISDRQCDFCFSYTVFQHMPTKEVVFDYLEEIYRVLKPGGIARIQFNGYWKTLIERYPKKYLVQFLGTIGIKRESYRFKGYFDTWVGVYISKGSMRRKMQSLGFQDLIIQDFGGTDVWVEARRPRN